MALLRAACCVLRAASCVLRAASCVLGRAGWLRLRCSARVGRTQPARAIPASTMTPAPNSIRRSLQTAGVDGEDAADPRGQAQGEMGDDVDDGQDGGPLMRRRQRDGTAPPPARTSRASPPRTGQSSSRSSPGRAPGPANRRTRRAPTRPNSLYTAFGRSGIARPDAPGLRRPLPGPRGSPPPSWTPRSPVDGCPVSAGAGGSACRPPDGCATQRTGRRARC